MSQADVVGFFTGVEVVAFLEQHSLNVLCTRQSSWMSHCEPNIRRNNHPHVIAENDADVLLFISVYWEFVMNELQWLHNTCTFSAYVYSSYEMTSWFCVILNYDGWSNVKVFVWIKSSYATCLGQRIWVHSLVKDAECLFWSSVTTFTVAPAVLEQRYLMSRRTCLLYVVLL